MISIQNITKTFLIAAKPFTVFERLSISVERGEILTILGPNGCGKSTLLNILSGVEPIQDGQIILNGSKVNFPAQVAYMLQKDLLLPWLTVYENITLGVSIKGTYTAAFEEKIDSHLDRLGVEHLKNRYPSLLSGGERQKIALIRTLILETPILLLDEPFSAIDYNSRLELQRTIFDYAKTHNTTVVLISHDIDEAISMSDRILILDYCPNGVKSTHLIDLNIDNRNPVTARFDPKYSAYYQLIWENYPR